ncbi:hypothetical protein Tco_1576622 [Tanacetum coccineum]
MLHAREDLMESIQNFLKKFDRISFRETPKVLTQAWDKFFEVKHAQSEEVQELLSKLVQDLQSINEELAEYINTPSWNLPTSSYDDDDDDVEDLVQIPSESEGIPDKMCDVPFRDNSPPLDISKDQFEGFSDSNDDSTLIDDDSFSINDIVYVEASPPDSELNSSGSTTTRSDYSLPGYEAFYFDDDHIEEKSSGSTTGYGSRRKPT